MALNLTKSFTFVPSTTIASSEVNTDFDTLYNAFSGLEGGTASMSKLPLDTDPTSALYAATKQYVDHYAAWRRPVLKWQSIVLVDIENNTGTANQTQILFPDGILLSVTEDTSSTNKYRRFDITATANFTSGTEDSGLRSGISEATNTWYAIYAVKSQINSANFVLAGDTTLPIQANYSTLNSRYGSNSWVYIGMIRNGDNSGATGDILSFQQSGHLTIFSNQATGNALPMNGLLLAGTTAASSVTYTYSAGTGTTAIPNNIFIGLIGVASSATAAGQTWGLLDNSTSAWRFRLTGNSATNLAMGMIPSFVTNGFVTSVNTGTCNWDIFLNGFFDNVLGVGSNPLI